jgi:hypothetical protein
MIAIAALLFIANETLLYYRWATMIEPTCVIVVDAGTQLKGATIEVKGVLTEPRKVTIGEGDRYTIPIYVEPGEYTLQVTQNDEKLLEVPVTFNHGAQGKKFDLHKLPAATTRPNNTHGGSSTMPINVPFP